ncbi:MAG: hypothetical protein NTY35_14440 [Planctomycetota bacterium]|nr:hypothetical protein [Planctomycetota bacterium]
MLTTLLFLALGTPGDTAAKPAIERLEVVLSACAESKVVRTTWLSDRRATVHTTTNGMALPPYPTHEERHLDRAVEVLECRDGVPQRLRVRYGEAFDKRLDQDPEPNGEEREAGAPTYTTEKNPLAGRSFLIVQMGESADVLLPEESPASPALARLVLEAECVGGGAVPLPGDTVARAIAASPREKGVAFEFDALVARELLGGDETAECAATFTFLGVERTPEGRTQARFDARIVVHEEPEGGLARDAELRGFLLAEPRSGRPLQFEVEGSERKLGAADDARNATEIESTGTWRVRRTWNWR